MKVNKGFTLAEVLVTLGIIGVVAALTMPTLMADSRDKQLIAALKKNNALIEQALLMTKEKYGYVDNAEMFAMNSTSELFNKITENLSLVKNCGMKASQGCVASYIKCRTYRNNGYGSTCGSNYDGSTGWAKATLANGASIWMFNYVKSSAHSNAKASSTKCGVSWKQYQTDSKGNYLKDGNGNLIPKKDANGNDLYSGVGEQCGLIGIDVNGPKKGPNQFGRDVFGYVVKIKNLSNWESYTMETMRNEKLYYTNYTPGKFE